MGEALRGEPGGIGSLCVLIDRYTEALEFDLLAMGLRLRWLGDGTGRLDWGDLLTIVKQAAPGSALRRAAGDGWSVTDHLLALVADELAVANWQRQGKRNAPRPRPIPRPGAKEEKVYGSDPIPLADFAAWWASN